MYHFYVFIIDIILFRTIYLNNIARTGSCLIGLYYVTTLVGLPGSYILKYNDLSFFKLL